MCGCGHSCFQGAAKEIAEALRDIVNKLAPVLDKACDTLNRVGVAAIREFGLLGRVFVIGVVCAIIGVALFSAMSFVSFTTSMFFWLTTPPSLVKDFVWPEAPALPFIDLALPYQPVSPLLLATDPSATHTSFVGQLPGGQSSSTALAAQQRADQMFQDRFRTAVSFDKDVLEARGRLQDKASVFVMTGFDKRLGAAGQHMRALEKETEIRLETSSTFFGTLFGGWKVIVLAIISVAVFLIQPEAVLSVLGGMQQLIFLGFRYVPFFGPIVAMTMLVGLGWFLGVV